MHIELYQLTRLQTLAEGAMIGYTEKGMQMAQDILVVHHSYIINFITMRFI